MMMCQQESGVPIDPPFEQENCLLAEAKVEYMSTHTQLKGFITLDNLEAALKYQNWPEYFRGPQRTVNR